MSSPSISSFFSTFSSSETYTLSTASEANLLRDWSSTPPTTTPHSPHPISTLPFITTSLAGRPFIHPDYFAMWPSRPAPPPPRRAVLPLGRGRVLRRVRDHDVVEDGYEADVSDFCGRVASLPCSLSSSFSSSSASASSASASSVSPSTKQSPSPHRDEITTAPVLRRRMQYPPVVVAIKDDVHNRPTTAPGTMHAPAVLADNADGGHHEKTRRELKLGWWTRLLMGCVTGRCDGDFDLDVDD